MIIFTFIIPGTGGSRNMFLAQLAIYSFRFCFGGYVRRGGVWGGGWGCRLGVADDGEGTESALRLYFHLRKIYAEFPQKSVYSTRLSF